MGLGLTIPCLSSAVIPASEFLNDFKQTMIDDAELIPRWWLSQVEFPLYRGDGRLDQGPQKGNYKGTPFR